jgi:hypothetical protein
MGLTQSQSNYDLGFVRVYSFLSVLLYFNGYILEELMNSRFLLTWDSTFFLFFGGETLSNSRSFRVVQLKFFLFPFLFFSSQIHFSYITFGCAHTKIL